MNRTAKRLATYEDLFDLLDHVIGEILHGQLITQPRPGPYLPVGNWAQHA